MATINFKGNPVKTSGELPAVGSKAPNFTLVGQDLKNVSLADYAGKKVVLNIFPSIDTGICAMSVVAFNKAAAELDNTVVVCVSKDLPFAQKRFCGAEGTDNVVTLSDYVDGSFCKDYGVLMLDGPLHDLASRAVLVLDETGTVVYSEQVPDIVQEPNYDAALSSLQPA